MNKFDQLQNNLQTLTHKRYSQSSYYAFGMMQPGRQYNSGDARYGFNGKEKDDEIKGTGNQQDYGMRIYDPRLGRFLSVDPLYREFPWWSLYHFAGNSPILAIDLDGAEIFIPQSIPLDPILTIPKSGPMTMPRVAPIPPIVQTYPKDVTVGQPNLEMSKDAPEEIDWNDPPMGPESLPEEWEETTHPDNKSGSRNFKNKNNGDEIRFDPGKEGKPGWEGKDHWHRLNPNKKNRHDEYLDKHGNPVRRGSDESHLEAGRPKGHVLPEIDVRPKDEYFQPGEKEKNWFEKTWDNIKELFKPSPPDPKDNPYYT